MKNKLTIIALALIMLFPYCVKAIEKPALSSLSIEGIGELNVNKTTQNVTLVSTLGYAEISATAKNPSYTITGTGKIDCTEGANTIKVTVTDPGDNSSQDYIINLTYKANTSSGSTGETTATGDAKNPETGSFVNVLAIAGGLVIGFVLLLKSRKKLFNRI